MTHDPREALKRIIQVYERNIGRQNEKLDDIPKIAREALTASPGEQRPVALAHVRLEDDGLFADLQVLDGTNLQPSMSPIALYLRREAPAPEGAAGEPTLAIRLEARPTNGSADWTEIFPAQLNWVAKAGHEVRAIETPSRPDAGGVQTEYERGFEAGRKSWGEIIEQHKAYTGELEAARPDAGGGVREAEHKVERILTRRVLQGRVDGYTLETSKEIVAALSTPPAAAESNASVEARLREALGSLIADIEDYESVNNLAPSPGKNDCWQSVTRAKEALSAVGDEAKKSEGGVESSADTQRGEVDRSNPCGGMEPERTVACQAGVAPGPSDPTAERREIVDEFRVIPGFEDYEISRDCRLRRIIPISATSLMPRILTARPTPEGYLKYSLRVNGKVRSIIAHRAVALAWLGLPPPGKPCVAHLDNVRTNNSVENLQWVSYKENEGHKKAHGTYRQGTACISSRLNDEIVLDARRRHAKGGVTIKDLSIEYKVRITTMADAVLGRSWKHLPMFKAERYSAALDGGAGE